MLWGFLSSSRQSEVLARLDSNLTEHREETKVYMNKTISLMEKMVEVQTEQQNQGKNIDKLTNKVESLDDEFTKIRIKHGETGKDVVNNKRVSWLFLTLIVTGFFSFIGKVK